MNTQDEKDIRALIIQLNTRAAALIPTDDSYQYDKTLLLTAANTLENLLPPKPTAEDIINNILHNQKNENINEIAGRMTAEMRKAGLLNE